MRQTMEILLEDKEILVCRKWAGIPVQTARMGEQDMVSLLKNYRMEKKEPLEIHVVHRLDQPVEGVMVFAKTQKAAASLSKQIQQKNVDKFYHAVVEGLPEKMEGTLEDWLIRDGRTNTSKVGTYKEKDAKKAVLHYKVIGSITKEDQVQSLVEIQLETGRHHQIRVQMAHAGYPLVGDKKYNPTCTAGYFPIGLCSVKLAFVHPTTGKKMEFSIEPSGEAFHIFQTE